MPAAHCLTDPGPASQLCTVADAEPAVILMDRQNLHAPGWSHVLSSTGDLAELEAFRLRVGAPLRAFHLRGVRRPHLDLKLEPRERALACGDILVFDRTADLMRYLRALEDEARSPLSA